MNEDENTAEYDRGWDDALNEVLTLANGMTDDQLTIVGLKNTIHLLLESE